MRFLSRLRLGRKANRYYGDYAVYRDAIQSDFDTYCKLLALLCDVEQRTHHAAASSISFWELENDASPRTARRKLGKPYLKVDNQNKVAGHRVYLYKLRKASIKSKCELHFFNNRLALVRNHLSELRQRQADQIQQIVRQKYFPPALEAGPLPEGATILDHYHNALWVE